MAMKLSTKPSSTVLCLPALFFMLITFSSFAVRLGPAASPLLLFPPQRSHHDQLVQEHTSSSSSTVEGEGNCGPDQTEEEEECLMRRTLEAHLDYVYTQKKNRP